MILRCKYLRSQRTTICGEGNNFIFRVRNKQKTKKKKKKENEKERNTERRTDKTYDVYAAIDC